MRSRGNSPRCLRRSALGVAVALLILAAWAAPAQSTGIDCARERGDALTCLACNVYHESRNQPVEGQEAVAMVTLNRLATPGYPKTVCEVVWDQRRDRRSGLLVAHFSWTLNEHTDRVEEPAAWARALQIAHDALGGSAGQDPSRGALFFHATYVDPEWSRDRDMRLVARIGDHMFYRHDRSMPLAMPFQSDEGLVSPRGATEEAASGLARDFPPHLINAVRIRPGAHVISLRPTADGGIQILSRRNGQESRMRVQRDQR
jgi:N-acetylmuramoyl-L-alanine amidase